MNRKHDRHDKMIWINRIRDNYDNDTIYDDNHNKTIQGHSRYWQTQKTNLIISGIAIVGTYLLINHFNNSNRAAYNEILYSSY